MFSRYKKSDKAPVAAVQNAAPAPEKRVEKPKAKPVVSAADSVAMDKELKRRQKLEEIRSELHHRLLDNLNLSALEDAPEKELKAEIASICAEGLEEMAIVLNKEERQNLHSELYDEVTGLGPLEPLLKDETINDILVNGPNRVFIERSGKLELTNTRFKDEKHLLRIIDKIVSAVGRRVDESNPYVDARLKDGSRFNAMVPPIAVDGSLVSIRKFKKEKLGIDELCAFGAFSEEMAAYLQMRPDRIIVGETRGEEVIDMLQAMNTGHDGSMTTIHANSARDGVSRLENMIAMAGIEMPIKAVRAQISSAVNLIVQASRLQDGSRRMVDEPAHEIWRHPAVFDAGRQGAARQYRVHTNHIDCDHGRFVRGYLYGSDADDGGLGPYSRADCRRDGRRRGLCRQGGFRPAWDRIWCDCRRKRLWARRLRKPETSGRAYGYAGFALPRGGRDHSANLRR